MTLTVVYKGPYPLAIPALPLPPATTASPSARLNPLQAQTVSQSGISNYPTTSLTMATPSSSPAPQPPRPLPPSPEECKFYYYHFLAAGRPQLVARTSTFVFENPQKPEAIMYPIPIYYTRQTPLKNAWADERSGLMERIMDAVEEVGIFHSIEPSHFYMNHGTSETLVISIPPKSMSWSRGIALAMRCKSILEKYGIHNVHCEIREFVPGYF